MGLLKYQMKGRFPETCNRHERIMAEAIYCGVVNQCEEAVIDEWVKQVADIICGKEPCLK